MCSIADFVLWLPNNQVGRAFAPRLTPLPPSGIMSPPQYLGYRPQPAPNSRSANSGQNTGRSSLMSRYARHSSAAFLSSRGSRPHSAQAGVSLPAALTECVLAPG
jgi:hypothetical protein